MGRTYTAAFRAEALHWLTTGRSVAEVARIVDMPQPTLWKWYYQAVATGELPGGEAGPPGSRPPPPADPVLLARQVRELEQRVAIMEEELAIVGKVSAFLARQRPT